jgi:tetratricopeptide (TPR) repeat protein
MERVSRLDLDGLSDDEVLTFMSRAAGHELDEPGRELAAAVHRETAGNPFFVGEVLRHLAESGAIVQREGTWTADISLEQFGIPEGIREVVGRRLTALDPDVEKVLSAASILGHEFDVDVLAEVAGIDADDVLDRLDEAVAANLVHEQGVGTFRFAHALVRSTLIEEVSTTRRARFHRKAAATIEARHVGRLDDVAAALAHHWAETADPDPSTAVEWALRAGDVALRRVAPDEAIDWFGRGLDLLDPDDPGLAQRARLLTGRADAMMRLGDRSFDIPAKEAARLGLQLRDPSLVAAALGINARMAWTRGFAVETDRLELVRAALDLDLDDHPAAHATLLVQLAQELLFLGERDERFVAGMRALEIAESGELTPDELYMVYRSLGPVMPRQAFDDDLLDRFEAFAQQVADHIDRAGTPAQRAQVCYSRCFAGLFNMDRERYDEARRGLDELRDVALDSGSQLGLALTDSVWYLAIGDLRAAEEAVDRLNAMATAQEDQTGTQYQSLVYFETARERGRIADLIPLIEAIPLSETDTQGTTAAVFACARATAGDADEARQHLEAARPFDDAPDDTGLPIVLACFADAAVRIGHVDALRELLPHLQSFGFERRRCGLATGGFYFGSLDSMVARVLAALGDAADADALFRSGIADVDAFGARAWSARSRLDYAQFCEEHGRFDDALRLATEAVDLVEGTELDDTRNLASALLDRLAADA